MDDRDERSGRGRNGHWFSREAWSTEEAKLAIGFHVTMRLADDAGIARTPSALRLASRIVLRHGEERGLLSHRLADTHLHAVLVGTRAEAGRFALCTEGALRKQLRIGIPFQRCRIRPIEDERHLGYAVRYGYRQEERHGTAFDVLHDGSSLVDLLGMRMGAPWLPRRMRSILPRVGRSALLAWLDAPDLDDQSIDVRHLPDAAAAAWGVGSLRGTSREHVRARRVAVHMLDRLAPRAGVTCALGIPARSGVRYRLEEVSTAELRAVDLQLKLRSLIERRRAAAEAPTV